MNQYLCIVAGQRAGTTALHSALESTGKFFNFKEVFHADPNESSGTFLRFSMLRDLRVADMATDTQAQKVALDYLAYLRDISKQQVPLLDIKFNSWHVLKPFWSYVHEMPFFMKVLSEERALFLFIRRRGLVEQVVSEHIARSADKWHNLEDGDILGQIHLKPAEVAGQARLILQSEAFLLACLGAGSGLITIDYEDLFPGGFVNPRLLRVLEEKLGVELPNSLQPTIKKNIPDKRQIVANYEAVAKAINGMIQRYPRGKIANQIAE